MKRGVQDAGFIDENRVMIGLSLGWDHTAEHERGIKGIQTEFGLPEVPTRRIHGPKARTMMKRSNNLRLLVDPELGFTYLALLTEFDWSHIHPERLDSWMGIRPHRSHEPIHTAWSATHFAVRVRTVEDGAKLEQLEAAFRKKDILIFLGGGASPFSNAGLVIAIKSRVPQKHLELMVKVDVDALDLSDMAEKTGIKERLEAAKLQFIALSPKLLDPEERIKRKTAHSVMFWLNPYDQQKHQYGWYTVEQLDEWIAGTGPVLHKRSA